MTSTARAWLRTRQLFTTHRLSLLAIVVLAVAIRWPLLYHESRDYEVFTSKWYAEIQQTGIRAVSGAVSDYAPIYMLLLWVVHVLFPSVAPVVAIKIPSMVCDLIGAVFAYRIVKRLPRSAGRADLVFAVSLCAPTIVLNGAFWGQADSLYTCALLASVDALILRRSWAACLAFGLALSFKLQSTFLLPLLLLFAAHRLISWKALTALPLVFVLSLVPALLAGRPVRDLVNVYAEQASKYKSLSLNAPTFFAWMSDHDFVRLSQAGVLWGLAVVVVFSAAVYRARLRFTSKRVVDLALIYAVLVPFCLPKMHERYFFPADVLSIVYAVLRPEMAVVPVAMTTISLLAYGPFLFDENHIPMPWLSLGVLALAFLILRKFARGASVDSRAPSGRRAVRARGASPIRKAPRTPAAPEPTAAEPPEAGQGVV